MPYTPKQNSGMLGDVFADMNQLDGTGLGADVDYYTNLVNATGQVFAPDTTADIDAWAESMKTQVAPVATILAPQVAKVETQANAYLNPPKPAPAAPGTTPTVIQTVVDQTARTITANQPLLLGGLALLAGALVFMRMRK